jgi:hypothetical protein
VDPLLTGYEGHLGRRRASSTSGAGERFVGTPEGARLRDFGLIPVGGSPEVFHSFLAEDAQIWSKVVRDNDIRVD